VSQDFLSQHLDQILETMHDGLVAISPQGRILAVNRALEAMTGFSRRELVGRPCAVFECDVCQAARQGGQAGYCVVFDERRLCAGNFRCLLKRRDGSLLPVLKNASLLRDARGEVIAAVETMTDISELDRRDRQIEELTRLLEREAGFQGMIGRSEAIRRVFEVIDKAAQSEAPVMIYGQSGTGKELAAKAIHDLGRRKDGPFVQLNCAALNEALLESELFGHVKGAFTGAYRHREGRFEAAHGGDIFLDEVGDLPLSIQVKLLRVLESKQFERVGDNRPVSVDVRVICATHRDLAELVARGEFRQDLFFRINVIPIHLPPLSQRLDDLPLLIEEFIGRLRARSGKAITGLSPEAMKIMAEYAWPGNVRELKAALEYAFVIAEAGLIGPEQLPEHLLAGRPRPGRPVRAAADPRAALIEALRQSEGNKSQAARLLGVSRDTVSNRMRKYGLDLKKVIAA